MTRAAPGDTLDPAPRTSPPGDGKTAYLNTCARCHGSPTPGINAEATAVAPKQFRPITFPTDIVKKGAGNIPAIDNALQNICIVNGTLGKLLDEEVRDISNYLLTVPPPRPRS